jgi:hypothetical protein
VLDPPEPGSLPAITQNDLQTELEILAFAYGIIGIIWFPVMVVGIIIGGGAIIYYHVL